MDLLCGVDEVNLSALVLRNNTALRSGGGLEINNIVKPVIVKGVRVENNRALLGGGIAVISLMNFTITGDGVEKPSVIKDNLASTAAGLYIEPGHEVFFSVGVSPTLDPITKQVELDMPGRKCNVRKQRGATSRESYHEEMD